MVERIVDNTTGEIEAVGPTLVECEQVIRRGLATFVEVGEALMAIRDGRLYREKGYTRFEDYCQEEWKLGRRHAYELIDGAQVSALLCATGAQIPTTERQARELVPLKPLGNTVVAEVWNDLREEHGDNITAAKIKVAVKEKVNAAYDDVREQILEANRQGAAIPVPPPLPVAHVAHNSGENEWYTPPAFIEAARRTMGSIDTDPASSGLANKIVGAKEYFTIEDDGLTKTWAGNVWMNPPFAQPLVTQFCTSLVEKIESGEITQACVLVNNFTETAIFQRMALACACFCFPRSRIKFLDVDGNPSGAPLQGQVILYFGPNVREFTASFGGMGVILYAIRST